MMEIEAGISWEQAISCKRKAQYFDIFFDQENRYREIDSYFSDFCQ